MSRQLCNLQKASTHILENNLEKKKRVIMTCQKWPEAVLFKITEHVL